VQALFNGPTVGPSLNGTTVTQGSGGNSGGGDSSFFDVVQIGATGSLIFDNAHVTHNVEAFRFTTGGTAGNSNVQWQGSITPAATMWFRIYIFTPSSFALTPTIVRMLDTTGATQACRIAWNASGNLLIRNTANTQVATSTNAMSVSTAYRLEGFCTQGASGTAEIKFWSSIDSRGAPVETLTAAAQNYGTNNIGNVAFGQVTAIANMPSWWGSGIAITDGGYLGPWQPPLSPVPARHLVYPVRRWARPATVPPAQLTAPPTNRPPRRTPTLRRRARPAGVPQAQAAPVAPAYVPPPVHHLLRLVARMRGRSTQAPIAQTAPLAPPYVAPPSRRLPRLLSAWTRGHRTSTPIAQTVPPPPVIAPQPALRVRRLLPLVTRRRPVAAPLAQVKAPAPTPRRRLPLPLIGRRRAVRVTPPQVVVVAPQRPPQPWRRRLLAALFGPRRHAVATLPSAVVDHACETPRPSTGVTARPSSGVTAYATAATARPSTGATAQPDTGITEDPC
jgi:hypothetical protein